MWNHNCSCNFPYSLHTSSAGIRVHPTSAFWDDGITSWSCLAALGSWDWDFSSVSRKRWVEPFRNHQFQSTASVRKSEITKKHSCCKTCYWFPEYKYLALKSSEVSKKNNSVLNVIRRSQASSSRILTGEEALLGHQVLQNCFPYLSFTHRLQIWLWAARALITLWHTCM